jgi:hypothetical protein
MNPALNGSAARSRRVRPRTAVAAVAPSSLLNVLLRIFFVSLFVVAALENLGSV